MLSQADGVAAKDVGSSAHRRALPRLGSGLVNLSLVVASVALMFLGLEAFLWAHAATYGTPPPPPVTQVPARDRRDGEQAT